MKFENYESSGGFMENIGPLSEIHETLYDDMVIEQISLVSNLSTRHSTSAELNIPRTHDCGGACMFCDAIYQYI